MITLIIGGEEGSSEVGAIWKPSQRPSLLCATRQGSFHKFCEFALESTKILVHLDSFGERSRSHMANDNFAVHFSNYYVKKNLELGTVMYKIATAIEMAIDLGLDVETIIVGEETETILKDKWPDHWPERQILND